MESTMSPTSSLPSRPTYSCIRCSDRKVKCDRQTPCLGCVKHNVQCVYRPPPQPRTRHRRAKDHALNERLKRYEALLQQRGIDPNGLPEVPDPEQPRQRSGSEAAGSETGAQLPTPSSVASDLERYIVKTQVVQGQGRSKFVDK